MTAVRLLANALGAGIPIDRARALSEVDWSPTLEKLLALARSTGIARARALTLLADVAEESERLDRLTAVGSASARQTACILAFLPAATVCAAELFGFHVIRVLCGSALGWVCLVTGALCVAIGWRWMSHLCHTVPRVPDETGLALLLAAELSRSGSLGTGTHSDLAELAHDWGTTRELETFDALRTISREFGVPVSNIAEIESQRIRRDAALSVEMAIELLPGRLLVPVGACLFPAFVLTTVIPIVMAMATNFIA